MVKMIPVVHGACIYGSLAAREHRLGHAQSTNDLRMHAVHQSVPPKSSSHLALPIPSSRAQEARAAGSEPKVSPTYALYPSGALYPRCPQRRRPFDVARVSPALEYYANAPQTPHYLHALTTRRCCTACSRDPRVHGVESRRYDGKGLALTLLHHYAARAHEDDDAKDADDNADDGARRQLRLLLGCCAVVLHGFHRV